MKKRYFWGLIALFLCLTGCEKPLVDPLAFRQEAFTLSAEGNLNGVDFSCDICCENGDWSRVEFHSPSPLEGVVLTHEGEDDIRAERDGLSEIFSASSPYFGLSLIADILCSLPLQVEQIQSLESGKQLTLSCKKTGEIYLLTLGADSFPVFLTGENFSCQLRRISDRAGG